MNNRPEISVIIVNWNTEELLRKCLRSVENHVGTQERETLVIDNNSSDGSVEMIKNEFPGVNLIRNADNRGFAAGVNQGLHASTGLHVLLINSDARIEDGVVQIMMQYLATGKNVGIVGPGLIYPGGIPQERAAGYEINLWNLASHYLVLDKLFPFSMVFRGIYIRKCDSPTSVAWVSGCAMLFRREVFEQIGPFDERLFMYMEDVDYCSRARDKGFDVHYLPYIHVIHESGASLQDELPDGSCGTYISYIRSRRGSIAGQAALCITVVGFSLRLLVYGLCGLFGRGKGRFGMTWKYFMLSIRRGGDC
ncbi:glycosyltransferase family 2 protein [Candidatus Hydrogenedentota bacterium]